MKKQKATQATQEATQEATQATQEATPKKEKFQFDFSITGLNKEEKKSFASLMEKATVKANEKGKTETCILYSISEIIDYGLRRNLSFDLKRAEEQKKTGNLKRSDLVAERKPGKAVEKALTAKAEEIRSKMKKEGKSEEAIKAILDILLG
jgi:hypothetical protein